MKRTADDCETKQAKRQCVELGSLPVSSPTEISAAIQAVEAAVHPSRNDLRQLYIAAGKAQSQDSCLLRELARDLNLAEDSTAYSVEQALIVAMNVCAALKKNHSEETNSACMAAMEQLVRVKKYPVKWQDYIAKVDMIDAKWRAYKSKRATGDDTTIDALLAAIVKKADGAQFERHPSITPGSYVVQQILSKPIENRGDYWPGQIEVNAWDHANALLHSPLPVYAAPRGKQMINWSGWDNLLQKHEVTSPYEAVLLWLLFESQRNMGGYEAQLLIEFLTAAGHKEQLVEYLLTHKDKGYGVREDGYFCYARAAPEKIQKLCENLMTWPDAAYHCYYTQMDGGRPFWDIMKHKSAYKFKPTTTFPVNRVHRPAGNPYP